MSLKKIDPLTGLRLFYPVVPVIVTVKSRVKINAMPAAWATPLSFKPPLVAVAIAPERYTYRLIQESRYFALNWLDFRYVEAVVYLGEVSSRYQRNKITAAGLTAVEGEKAPVLGEAVGIMECRLADRFRIGDHDLFVGECLSASASEDFTETWELKEYSPIFTLGIIRGARRRRRFLSLEKGTIDVLCPTGREIERRRKVIEEVRKTAVLLTKELGRPVRLNEVAARVAVDLRLELIDVKLIAEQLRREGEIKVVKS